MAEVPPPELPASPVGSEDDALMSDNPDDAAGPGWWEDQRWGDAADWTDWFEESPGASDHSMEQLPPEALLDEEDNAIVNAIFAEHQPDVSQDDEYSDNESDFQDYVPPWGYEPPEPPPVQLLQWNCAASDPEDLGSSPEADPRGEGYHPGSDDDDEPPQQQQPPQPQLQPQPQRQHTTGDDGTLIAEPEDKDPDELEEWVALDDGGFQCTHAATTGDDDTDGGYPSAGNAEDGADPPEPRQKRSVRFAGSAPHRTHIPTPGPSALAPWPHLGPGSAPPAAENHLLQPHGIAGIVSWMERYMLTRVLLGAGLRRLTDEAIRGVRLRLVLALREQCGLSSVGALQLAFQIRGTAEALILSTYKSQFDKVAEQRPRNPPRREHMMRRRRHRLDRELIPIPWWSPRPPLMREHFHFIPFPELEWWREAIRGSHRVNRWIKGGYIYPNKRGSWTFYPNVLWRIVDLYPPPPRALPSAPPPPQAHRPANPPPVNRPSPCCCSPASSQPSGTPSPPHSTLQRPTDPPSSHPPPRPAPRHQRTPRRAPHPRFRDWRAQPSSTTPSCTT